MTEEDLRTRKTIDYCATNINNNIVNKAVYAAHKRRLEKKEKKEKQLRQIKNMVAKKKKKKEMRDAVHSLLIAGKYEEAFEKALMETDTQLLMMIFEHIHPTELLEENTEFSQSLLIRIIKMLSADIGKSGYKRVKFSCLQELIKYLKS